MFTKFFQVKAWLNDISPTRPSETYLLRNILRMRYISFGLVKDTITPNLQVQYPVAMELLFSTCFL